MKAPKTGVGGQEPPCGGHRSARSAAQEDWEEAVTAARPRFLTARGRPPSSLKESPRQRGRLCDRGGRLAMRGGVGRQASLEEDRAHSEPGSARSPIRRGAKTSRLSNKL